MNEVNWMQQGWECPKCGAVMAPHVDCCVNCRGNKGGGTATSSPTMINGDPIFNYPSSTCTTSSPLDPPYVLTKDVSIPEAKYTDIKRTIEQAKEDAEKQWDRYYQNV